MILNVQTFSGKSILSSNTASTQPHLLTFRVSDPSMYCPFLPSCFALCLSQCPSWRTAQSWGGLHGFSGDADGACSSTLPLWPVLSCFQDLKQLSPMLLDFWSVWGSSGTFVDFRMQSCYILMNLTDTRKDLINKRDQPWCASWIYNANPKWRSFW